MSSESARSLQVLALVVGVFGAILGFMFATEFIWPGRNPDCLPSGLDKEAIAKSMAGTWKSLSVGEPLPNGDKHVTEQDVTFIFEPNTYQHGKFTKTNGGHGGWTVLEITESPDGTYSGRMEVFDTRDFPIGGKGGIANASTDGKWRVRGLTRTRFIHPHPLGTTYEWKKTR